MKIAVITAFPHDPGSPAGGVEAVSVNLVRALANVPGADLHVVTTDRGSSEVKVGRWQGATIHRLPARGPLLTYAIGPGRRQLHRFLRELRPDVVHAHDTFGIMVKGLRIPRVFTVHGFIHEDTLSIGGARARLRAKIWKFVELSSWADHPHIIAITPFVRQRLRGIARGTIHDIDNPVSKEFFDIETPCDQAVIFSAAAIRKLKNTLGLVKAFSLIARMAPQATLRLAGPTTEPEYAAQVRDFIVTAGLSRQVSLLGSLSADQVRSELARAGVVALLSFHENAPMCVAEAMAAGRPVVTSNRCGMPYMIDEGQSGYLVDPNDQSAAAQRLQMLLLDPVLRERMARNARESALARFHPVAVAEKTMAVYSRAISQSLPSTRKGVCHEANVALKSRLP